MKRVEVIISQSISDDFVFLCKEKIEKFCYTKITNVSGEGYCDPKLGNEVWPQFNDYYLVVCSENDFLKLKECLSSLRNNYSKEGIAAFVTEVEEV